MIQYTSFVIVLMFARIVWNFALPHEGLYTLDIIHFNDFHARFEETSVETPTCRYNNNSCLGGFPRLYHEIEVLLQEKPNAILLDAGDDFQGTYWYTLLKWNVTQEFMNLMPIDAHAIGNHEFDDGPSNLAQYLSHLKAPILCANMDTSDEPVMQGLYQNHTIIERNGRKIGLIGLITTDTQKLSNPGNVVFTDPFEATEREAKLLTEMGVDIIVLLSHCGLDVDKKLAREYGHYIDIIVGGHTHSLLWNGPVAPSHEFVDGTYPVFVESSQDGKNETVIVQASAFTKYMGNLTVYFDYLGRYVSWEGGPVFLNRSISEDLSIKAKLQPYADLVHEVENTPVGETLTTLHFSDCVFGECALGDLIVDGLVELGQSKVQSTHPFLSIMQRGNIKSSFLKGNITQGDILDMQPYNDRIESFELQGNYVLEALERSVVDAWAYEPFKGPWVLQVSGLRVTYNVSLPEGHRVTSATLSDGITPIDGAAYYQVIAPAYLADGGDGFVMLKNGKKNVQVIGRDQSAVTNYIKKHSPLDLTVEGRITINY